MNNKQSYSDIFRAFLKLGVTSFGGPVAHLGYFRQEFVERRQWITEKHYADLIALCQFLPGPTSSKVGFAIGLYRGGFWGAMIAWFMFTMPSALILFCFAYGASAMEGGIGQGIMHGLKLVAVAVIAQAVWGMARSLCPDWQRIAIALIAILIIFFLPGTLAQVSAILCGAILGIIGCRHLQNNEDIQSLPLTISKRTAQCSLVIFLALLFGIPLALTTIDSQVMALFEAFYRTGALVFGGGHVVLPLLEASVVDTGWTSADKFLAGYSAAQAVPGPLFTVAAYLGAIITPEPNGIYGALIALIAIFLPGMLLLVAALPYWEQLRTVTLAKAAMAGANAAVVGILAAALYNPVWTSAVKSVADIIIILVAFALLTRWKVVPWLIVLLTSLTGAATHIVLY